MTDRRTTLRWLAAGALGPAGVPQLRAADFPERQIRVVSPTAPGGALDVVGRVLIERMQRILGQPVVIEHRPGGNGAVAATAVARGPKDGYSIFYGTGSMLGFAKLLNPELTYEPVKDFTPVAMVGSVPVGIFTTRDSGITSLEALIAAAKGKPGGLNFGSTGLMSLAHMSAELLMQRAGIKMTHVPYTSTAARYWVDLMGGRLDVVFAGATGGLPLHKDGKLNFLATATSERSKLMPDIPAVGETFKGYDVPAWFGFAVAAGTPAAIVQKLENATNTALQEPTMRAQFANVGVDLGPILGSEAFAARIAEDNKMWEVTLRAAGLVK